MLDMEAGAAIPIETPAIPGVVNLRDVGGRAVTGGREVRTGVLYRSAELGRLGDGGGEAIVALGIRRVYDLRTRAERRLLPDLVPDGTRSIVLDILADSPDADPAALMRLLADPAAARARLGDGGTERFFIDAYRAFVALPSATAGFGRLFQDLAVAGHRPALVHCTTGKDRTGWAAAVLLMFLGVPERDVLDDYLLSNVMLRPAATRMLAEFAARGGDPELIRPLTEVRESYLDAALDEVRQRYGTIEAYVARGLGLDAAGRAELRRVFLVDRSPAPPRSEGGRAV
jgi:protein-tyrosine phosphatase